MHISKAKAESTGFNSSLLHYFIERARNCTHYSLITLMRSGPLRENHSSFVAPMLLLAIMTKMMMVMVPRMTKFVQMALREVLEMGNYGNAVKELMSRMNL